MIGHPVDDVDSRERDVLRGGGLETVTVQQAHQDPQTPGYTGTKQARMSAEDVMTFWNCMVPCGWSFGGLVAFLLNRKQTSASKTSALRAILLGILSTLCYLIAVRQAENVGTDHTFQRPEAQSR